MVRQRGGKAGLGRKDSSDMMPSRDTGKTAFQSLSDLELVSVSLAD